MPDWENHVLQHLSLPELNPGRERRIVRELASQLDEFYREALSGGMDEEEAAVYAEQQIRDWDGLAEEFRRVDRSNFQPILERWADQGPEPQRHRLIRALATWIRTDRFAARRLIKSPRFLLVTLLTLGLGIGANTALFSVVHSVLLSPLPYENPEQLVFLWETRDEGSKMTSVSLGNFEAWRASSFGRLAMAAARWRAFNVTGRENPYRVDGFEVSPGLMSLLGKQLLHGREFTLEDEKPGTDAVCLVSCSFWEERLGANPDLTELQLVLNDRSHAVVGVLPKAFELPGFGPSPILTPLTLNPSDPGYWSNHNAMVLGRLVDGQTLSQENERLSLIAAGLEEARREWNKGIGVQLVPAREQLIQGVRRTLWVLFGAVGFILLIACVNVASLLLARATSAEVDVAIRMALGANRLSIMRLLLSEALLLSIGGGLLGLLIAYSGVETFRLWGPSNLPRINEISVNTPVLLFTLACAVGAGLLAGLVPALRVSNVDLQTSLNRGGRSPGMGSHHRVQRAFVIVEVAIAVILLNCSGLLLRSLTNLIAVDPGFDSEDRVAMQVTLSSSRYLDRESVTTFLDELHARLDAMPGVQASGSSVGLPYQWQMWRKQMTVEGRPAQTLPDVPLIDLSISTPGYARTLGIPLLEGRLLSDGDGPTSHFVALVNEEFVRTHLSGDDALGRRVRFSPPDALLPPEHDPEQFPWYTIVGVVGDVKRWNLRAEAFPEVFISQRQDMDTAREFFVVVRTSLPVESLAATMRRAVWEVDPDLPVAWVQPIEEMTASQMAQPRFNAALVGAFALVALMLAVIGVYALMANMVGLRRSEIGLRIALGARPDQIAKRIGGTAVGVALRGIAIGVVGSFAATQFLASMLFGIGPLDAGTFLFVVTTVLLVAATAALIPARRAAKLDAVAALSTQ